MNLLPLSAVLWLTSIYSLSFQAGNGTTVSFSQFQGKKILLVNVATGSQKVSQLGELQQLHEQYPDSLVIIAFPSNSFGHESRADSAIGRFCGNVYNASFTIAGKGNVKDGGMTAVYQWLANAAENGGVAGEVKGDFQKFLIDEQGNIVGIFAPGVSPVSQTIRDAVSARYN